MALALQHRKKVWQLKDVNEVWQEVVVECIRHLKIFVIVFLPWGEGDDLEV